MKVDAALVAGSAFSAITALDAGGFQEVRRRHDAGGRVEVFVIQNVAGVDGNGQVVAMLGGFTTAAESAASSEAATTTSPAAAA